MSSIFIIMALIFVFFFFYNNKIRLKIVSFFKKGLRAKRGKFGIYCYVGKQGSFKTYSAVDFLLSHKNKKIFSNVTSIRGVKYTPIVGGLDGLLSLRHEHDCIIFFDELFTILTRQSRITPQLLDFLSQMRKRGIIFITTAQEWLEIPITLRRYCRYQIDCKSISLPFLPTFIIKRFYDAENMKWSNLDNDYVAPLLETTISKANLYVANSYDTTEEVNS